MKVNKECIKVELEVQEYKDLVFCIKKNLDNCHINLISAENKGIDTSFHERQFDVARRTYEGLTGSKYDIEDNTKELLKRFPRLAAERTFIDF